MYIHMRLLMLNITCSLESQQQQHATKLLGTYIYLLFYIPISIYIYIYKCLVSLQFCSVSSVVIYIYIYIYIYTLNLQGKGSLDERLGEGVERGCYWFK